MKVDIVSIFLSGIIYIESFLLYVFNTNRCSTPAATVFPIPCLCSDFRPVLADHPDIVFAVHCDEVHHAAPQPGVKLLDELLLLKLLDEAVHLTAPGFAILDGFTGLVVLCLYRFIPADQFVVVPVIIIVLWHFPFIRFRFFGQEVDGEPLPMTLGHVFRNAPAFFLCQAAHDGEEDCVPLSGCPRYFWQSG